MAARAAEVEELMGCPPCALTRARAEAATAVVVARHTDVDAECAVAIEIESRRSRNRRVRTREISRTVLAQRWALVRWQQALEAAERWAQLAANDTFAVASEEAECARIAVATARFEIRERQRKVDRFTNVSPFGPS